MTTDAGGDGILWRSLPHLRAAGTRAPLRFTPSEGKLSLTMSATPERAAENEDAAAAGAAGAEEGEAVVKTKKRRALPQGAPRDARPLEAEMTMVLPAEQYAGAQVVLAKPLCC